MAERTVAEDSWPISGASAACVEESAPATPAGERENPWTAFPTRQDRARSEIVQTTAPAAMDWPQRRFRAPALKHSLRCRPAMALLGVRGLLAAHAIVADVLLLYGGLDRLSLPQWLEVCRPSAEAGWLFLSFCCITLGYEELREFTAGVQVVATAQQRKSAVERAKRT